MIDRLIHKLAIGARRVAADELRHLAAEHELERDDPRAPRSDSHYREGVAHVCAALRKRAAELDGGAR